MTWLWKLWTWIKGYRTFVTAGLVAIYGVLELANWSDLIPDGPNKGYVLLGLGALFAVLRAITTTPPFKAEPKVSEVATALKAEVKKKL